jgi:magnesium chelatase family protein
MTTALAHTHVLSGLSTQPVRVEADLANGLPQFSIVGLPSTAVREARDRVRAALVNAGFGFPDRRVTINLAPADLPKDSGRFDLAIALSILAAFGKIPAPALQRWVFAGELSLSGELLPIRAAFAYGLSVVRGLRGGDAMTPMTPMTPMTLMAPAANAAELALLGSDAPIVCVATLAEACAVVQGRLPGCRPAAFSVANISGASGPAEAAPPVNEAAMAERPLRWESVRGQEQAQFAAMVAAAGHHSLLLLGPPGVGKSMIAERLVTLVPALQTAEAQEVLALQSLDAPATADPAMALIQRHRLWRRPPFRAPHHTTSSKALVGGGNPIRPGEISLAHRGVLFLDELPEFPRDALESLREPLQTGEVRVVRVRDRQTLPARVLLVAAMNPCPCGFYGAKQSKKPCRCTAEQIARYQGRLSGPLLDRFDLAVMLQPASERAGSEGIGGGLFSSLMDTDGHLLSTEARQQAVCTARERALARQGCPNAHLAPEVLDRLGVIAPEAQGLLAQFIARTDASLRVADRLTRVAMTLADLQGADRVAVSQMAQSIDLRRGLDRPAALAE